MSDAVEIFLGAIALILAYILAAIIFGFWVGGVGYVAVKTYDWLNEVKLEGVHKNVKTV